MMVRQLRLVSISLLAGSIITALAHVLYAQGGELVAVPGILISGWIDLVAYLMSRQPDDFPQILSWQFCSVAFYSAAVYLMLLAVIALRSERLSGTQNGEI